jgi:hypothetical protein
VRGGFAFGCVRVVLPLISHICPQSPATDFGGGIDLWNQIRGGNFVEGINEWRKKVQIFRPFRGKI